MTRHSHDVWAVKVEKWGAGVNMELSRTAFEGLGQGAAIFIQYTLTGLNI